MLLIDFNFKHGIRKGFDDFTFYFDLVLFWHRFLSLPANTLFPLDLMGILHPNGIFLLPSPRRRGANGLSYLRSGTTPHILLNMAAVTRSASDTLNNYDDCKGYKMAAVVTAATNY